MNHVSRVLGYAINAENANQIDPDDLGAVALEVGRALSELNSQIKAAGVAAASHQARLSASELKALHDRRSFLAQLHQQLLQLRGRYRRQEIERQQAAEAERAAVVPDLSHYFQQVVRNESRPADYQRWVLQAEMRRGADLSRVRQKQTADRVAA